MDGWSLDWGTGLGGNGWSDPTPSHQIWTNQSPLKHTSFFVAFVGASVRPSKGLSKAQGSAHSSEGASEGMPAGKDWLAPPESPDSGPCERSECECEQKCLCLDGLGWVCKDVPMRTFKHGFFGQSKPIISHYFSVKVVGTPVGLDWGDCFGWERLGVETGVIAAHANDIPGTMKIQSKHTLLR